SDWDQAFCPCPFFDPVDRVLWIAQQDVLDRFFGSWDGANFTLVDTPSSYVIGIAGTGGGTPFYLTQSMDLFGPGSHAYLGLMTAMSRMEVTPDGTLFMACGRGSADQALCT